MPDSAKVVPFGLLLEDLDDFWIAIHALNHRISHWFPKLCTEVEEAGGTETLISKEDHFVIKKGLANLLDRRLVQRLAQIDSVYLSTKGS